MDEDAARTLNRKGLATAGLAVRKNRACPNRCSVKRRAANAQQLDARTVVAGQA